MSRQFGALSGLAIILIVINHAISMGLNPPQNINISPVTGLERNLLSILQTLGIFAVPIFLFISGSFTAYAARDEPPRLSTKFLITSLKHILFPYIFWSLLFYALVYIHYAQSYSMFGYLKYLLVGYPFHYVPLLTFYYLISPFLVRIGKTHGGLLILVIAFYQLLLLNIVYPEILGFYLPEWVRNLSPPVLRNTMADWAIFFPMGLIFGMHTKSLLPTINKLRWIITLITMIFFILVLLDGVFHIIEFPISRSISMTAFILIIPVIKRDNIPFARQLEKIGRKSYGIYLTHLILIDISLVFIQTAAWRLYYLPLIVPLLLFSLGISLPLSLMELASRAPIKRYYRYVFG